MIGEVHLWGDDLGTQVIGLMDGWVGRRKRKQADEWVQK